MLCRPATSGKPSYSVLQTACKDSKIHQFLLKLGGFAVQAKQCLELTQKTLSATQPAGYVENGAVAAGFRRFVAELISRTAARVEPSSIVRFDISPGAFQT